jgi:argininosuccinate lyase
VAQLQWGGRFTAAPDEALLAFGSSLEEDLVLAPFDVTCSTAHVRALRGGSVISSDDAAAIVAALETVAREIDSGAFVARARTAGAEDVHGAIDARVRELAGAAGELLHAGRSRNDQVATTLLLYTRDRASRGAATARAIAASIVQRARDERDAGTMLAGCTHRQPAQPVLLAFVLVAWAEQFVRAARRFAAVESAAAEVCPLGSGALAGSTLPLDRAGAAAALGFTSPSRNALDAVGNRDAALDLAHACVRTLVDASRICEELIAWSAPAYGFVRLADRASTGSSLMPQKRNPDPFELVRARAASMVGSYAGALAMLCGLATSYQRDLQETKAVVISIVERSSGALDAFGRALDAVTFDRGRMSSTAGDGYTVATDVADALIANGATARVAHALAGAAVVRAESLGRALDESDVAAIAAQLGAAHIDAPLTPRASIAAKQTSGSTGPAMVDEQIASLHDALTRLEART